MKLATLSGPHPTDCTGCPVCSEVAAAILANPRNPVLIETMSHPRLRTLAEYVLRNATADDSTTEILDPYEEGLVALRAAQGIRQPEDDTRQLEAMSFFRDSFYATMSIGLRAASNPASSDAILNPPDPYEEALQQRRERP